MATLTIELPAHEDQTAFNLQRWSELVADTELGRALARVEGRVETDRHGHIVMSPPASFSHGSYQAEIARLLKALLPHGRSVTECPISTADGVKAADVAWISNTRLVQIGDSICLTAAPEICVEVLSPSNTRMEMREKTALYFAAGAQEVWVCDQHGSMTFFFSASSAGEQLSRSCPDFPRQIIF